MNRKRWTTVLALLLVPLLTAGGFLWGTAYADTGLRGVQAAIVNNDEMVEVNGQPMPLGRQLTAELVDSDREQNLHWVLATEEKAAEGLATGRYAAVVTIPKEFSAAATSFGGEASEARRATIHVETSPVAGLDETALGQTIADAAANALNRFLTGEYLKNIYVGFNEMHAQMLVMLDGTAKLADGAGQLADGAHQSADGAYTLADGLDLAAAGSPQLRDGARQSASGADALADGLGLASAGSAQLRAGVASASDGAGQLADGAGALAAGTNQWADGADTYADGVDTYAAGVETYAAGAHEFADGVTQYTGGVNSLVVPLRDGLNQLPEWAGWIDEIADGVSTLTERAVAWDAQVQAFLDEARAWIRDAMAVAPEASAVSDGVEAAAARAAALASGTATCPEGLDEAACEAYRAGLADAGQQVADALASVRGDAADLAVDADVLRDTGEGLLALLDRISELSTEMVAWAPEVQAELERLRGSVPEGTPLSKEAVLALLDQFIDGGRQLDAGGQALAEGADQLAGGADQLAGGARQLSGGARELADGTGQLAGGMAELAGGLDQLSTGVNAYTGGVDQAAGGARLLADGLGQLSSGIDAYTGGIDQAAGGASLLAGGLGQLADGASELAGGTRTLADGVAEGADAIPTYTDAERDQLSEVVAAPVETSGLSALVRPNLAWVSLLLTTALWIGALATFAVLGRTSRHAALSTAGSGDLLRRALLPGIGIVAAQAVLLAIAGWVALKLTPSEGVLLTGVLLAAGVVFAMVNHALASLFGNGGRIAALVMAVVTAVTATTATAPGIFEALRVLSPVSPALDAVRAVSTGTGVTIPLLLLVGWGLVALVGSVASVSRARMVPLSAVLKAA